MLYLLKMGFPGGSGGTNSTCHAGLGRSPGVGNGNPLQYSCLENPMDTGAWRVTVPGVTKSQMRLNDYHFPFFKNMVQLERHYAK